MKSCPKCGSCRIQTGKGVIKSYRCIHCGWIEISYIEQGMHSFPSRHPLRLLLRSSWVYVVLTLVILGGGYLISAEVITTAKYISFLDKLPLFSEESKTTGNIKPNPVTTKAPEPVKLQVVGNNHSKLYHLPGMIYYDKIPDDQRVVFPSEEAAQQAGYRKAPK
jgi:hypothetical protein